jgi:phosphopantothenoylcysteine decarboxylase/phosphopantothenate--cysteine ligase
LAVTGGIAAYKAAALGRLLRERGAEVQVVMTATATRFVGPATFEALTGRPVHTDLFERSESVLHVRLAHEADAAVVAPATADVIAKLANGLADDLVSATLLEVRCPLIVAPAMHSGMWANPATERNVAALADRGATIVGPVEGPLAAGDEGMGRMAEPTEIADAATAVLGPRDLAGARVLVTAGPTHEPVDAVRFLGNRSSGRMGVAIAEAASARGATVTLVLGPSDVTPPAGVDVVRVETAREMGDAVDEAFERVDAVVMAAAVADFRPAEPRAGKIKKDSGVPSLELEPTPDILAGLGKRKSVQVLVGFAAETEDVEAEGRRKLAEKNLDMVVANLVGRPGTGFGSATNRAAILAASGDDVPMREWTKRELAGALCDRLAALLAARS